MATDEQKEKRRGAGDPAMPEPEDLHRTKDRFSNAMDNIEALDVAQKSIEEAKGYIRHRRLQDLELSTVTLDAEVLGRRMQGTGVNLLEWFEKEKYHSLPEVSVRDVQGFLLCPLEDEACKANGEPYSHGYKRNFRKVLRNLLKWQGKEYKETTIGAAKSDNKGPEDIVPPGTMMDLVDAARNSRDMALLGLITDTSIRIGFAGSLRRKHVKIRDNFAKVYVNPEGPVKTAKNYVVTTWSTAYLQKYLETEHPAPEDPNAPFWCKLKTDDIVALDYQSFRRAIRRAAKYADIDEDVAFHKARSGTISEWILEGKSEQEIKHRATWTKNSRQMFEVYGNFRAEDMNREILRDAGLIEEDEEDEDSQPQVCPRCRAGIPPGSDKCPRSTLLLNQDAAEGVRTDSTDLTPVGLGRGLPARPVAPGRGPREARRRAGGRS